MPLVRTNVTLPQELLHQIDDLAGPRGRSAFIADALAQRVKRERLGNAIRDTAGATVGTPDWRSPDEISEWARDLRTGDRDPWAEVRAGEGTSRHLSTSGEKK